MSNEFQTDVSGGRVPDLSEQFPPLPPWLARRLLRREESVTWVVGPKFNPSWERFVTHPLLFLVALTVAVLCLLAGRLIGGDWANVPPFFYLAAGGLIFGTIFVLGFCSGYFTRLVVTNYRLVILQGYEICRSWNIDDLPPSLLRYRARGTEIESRAIDLDALKTMLGSGSGHFVEAKTILAFSKQLKRINDQRDRRS
jgi:hypothetical protein